MVGLTSVTDTSVVNLNAHLVRFGRSDLDVLNRQGLTGSPGNCSLYMFLVPTLSQRLYLRYTTSYPRQRRIRAYLASDGLRTLR